MKRVIIVFIMLLVTTVVSNAQFFVDGDLDVTFEKYSFECENVKTPLSHFTIIVSPQVGYWMNDKVAVGARVSFITRHQKAMTTNTEEQRIEIKTWTPGCGFSVFGRYKLWSTEKLSILAESSIGIGGNLTKEKIGSTTEKLNSTSSIAIHLVPMITYDLSEKFSVKAICDFLDLGYDFIRTKYESNNRKSTFSRLGFGLQSSTYVRIGFIYNF